MMRIMALTEAVDSDDDSDNEIQVTREAEEEIAVSEYMRALKMKQDGRTDCALHLLKELLTAQVVANVTEKDKNHKLFSVKYNCHKNIGFIHLEKGEEKEALDYLLNAGELDNTDVYTMSRLGQLALKMNELDIAFPCFELCLKQNPNHWPSADGILQILCLKRNINEAYGWALKWYDKDNRYQRALDVILEIRERFKVTEGSFIEHSWKLKFDDKNGTLKRTKTTSVFPPRQEPEEPPPPKDPDLSKFKVKELTWFSMGRAIADIYKEYGQDADAQLYIFKLEDFLQDTEKESDTNEIEKANCESSNVEEEESYKVDSVNSPKEGSSSPKLEESNKNSKDIMSESQTEVKTNNDEVMFAVPSTDCQAAGSSGDENNSKTSELSETSKSKPSRRRGSDLSFLEQWGWHKNRRYSSKKKNEQERKDFDTTINGFMKRIMVRYFEDSFEDENVFTGEKIEHKTTESDIKMVNFCSSDIEVPPEKICCQKFQEETKEEFNNYLNDFKNNNYDICYIVRVWVYYIMKFWNRELPKEILDIYLELFPSYTLHFHSVDDWHFLNDQEYADNFHMMIFYLELSQDRAISRSQMTSKNQEDPDWKKFYYSLRFQATCLNKENPEQLLTLVRYHWLVYGMALYEYDLDWACDLTYIIEEMIVNEKEDYRMEFPNLENNNRITRQILNEYKISLSRTLSLKNAKNLYESEQYDELIAVMKECLLNPIALKYTDDAVIKPNSQIELILESFFHVEKYEECFIWCEKALKYAYDNYSMAFQNKYIIKEQEWGDNINYILTYMEAILNYEGSFILESLGKYLNRLVQTLTGIVTLQLDAPIDKSNNTPHRINIKFPWSILHIILERDENKYGIPKQVSEIDKEPVDILQSSIMIFFTAHDFIGKRSWCSQDESKFLLYAMDVIVPKFRLPYLEIYRDIIGEYLEQMTYCLYGYPPKKGRQRYLEEHNATNVQLTWERAQQLYEVFKPDTLPDFNSYKLESITSDTESLLQRIVELIPSELNPSKSTGDIVDFIEGKRDKLPGAITILPFNIRSLYYLLADYYFKNRVFEKSIEYYLIDLAIWPTRFDSWAGLALSKGNILETKLNFCNNPDANEFISQSEETMRCFERCAAYNDTLTLCWIEYGSFAYTLHAFCARTLKHASETYSLEEFEHTETRKEKFIKVAFDCFTKVEQLLRYQSDHPTNVEEEDDDDDSHDEKWLYHYMLGKIAEKQKEELPLILDHYDKSSKFLYESNATYPIKISHSNPQNLSIEALEVFYRITAVIIKYLEHHGIVTKGVGKLFMKTLKDLAVGPFSLTQAKISGTALKRKMNSTNTENAKKILKTDSNRMETETGVSTSEINTTAKVVDVEMEKVEGESELVTTKDEKPIDIAESNKQPILPEIKTKTETSPSRRESQESSVTLTTATSATTTSSSSDSSSSDSSDSDSTSDDESNYDTPMSEDDINVIYKYCIKNLEECVTRFPEHFKSIFRLANHYLNGPTRLRDVNKCKQLLLGTYTTTLGNKVQGMFTDRKTNNFFNGIWRNPCSEIDRPGSFSAHLSKSVVLLMETLKVTSDYHVLFELAVQLQRTPDPEKRYIKDVERKEFFQQAISYCAQVFRSLIKRYEQEKNTDSELFNLLLDIYKIQKNSCKVMANKESLFSGLLTEAFKVYIRDKIPKVPDTYNYLESANKVCAYEMVIRKNSEKSGTTCLPLPPLALLEAAGVLPKIKLPIIQPLSTPNLPCDLSVQSIPSVTPKQRNRTGNSKSMVTTTITPPASNLQQNKKSQMTAAFDPLTLLASSPAMAQITADPTKMRAFLTEYYRQIELQSNPSNIANMLSSVNTQITAQPISGPPKSTTATVTSQSMLKNQSTTITVGGGQLTITPTGNPSGIKSGADPKTSKSVEKQKDTERVHKSNKRASLPTQFPEIPKVPMQLFQDMPGISITSVKSKKESSAMNMRNDLPKSLSITTSNTLSGNGVDPYAKPQKIQTNPMPEKSKKTSEKRKSNTNPFAKMPMSGMGFPGMLPQPGFMNDLYGGMANMKDYTNQLAYLNTVAGYLTQTMGPSASTNLLAQMGSMQNYLSQTMKPPAKQKSSASKSNIPNLLPTNFGMAATTKKTSNQTKSIPSAHSNKPQISNSPKLSQSLLLGTTGSPMNLSRQSMTPPNVSGINKSPTKTLQEKLVERQKANAMNELAQLMQLQQNYSKSMGKNTHQQPQSSNGNDPKSKSDKRNNPSAKGSPEVIILD